MYVLNIYLYIYLFRPACIYVSTLRPFCFACQHGRRAGSGALPRATYKHAGASILPHWTERTGPSHGTWQTESGDMSTCELRLRESSSKFVDMYLKHCLHRYLVIFFSTVLLPLFSVFLLGLW